MTAAEVAEVAEVAGNEEEVVDAITGADSFFPSRGVSSVCLTIPTERAFTAGAGPGTGTGAGAAPSDTLLVAVGAIHGKGTGTGESRELVAVPELLP